MPEVTTPVVSAVHEVQVFRSGAVVIREAALRAGQGGALALEGLPLCLDDESVRVTLQTSDAQPADVRAELVLPPLGRSFEPPGADELRAAERHIEELRHRASMVDAELSQLEGVALALPAWEGKEPARPAPAALLREVVDWSAKAREKRLVEREALAGELQVAQEALARLRRREVEARALRDARADAVSKRVVLRLRGQPLRAPATLRLEYRVPGAWWVPTYVLRLARDGRSAQLGVRAHVTQRTGEPWERVRLFLSTADLRRETELPELRSLRIGRRQPEPAKRAWREPPVAGEALLEGLNKAVLLARQQPTPPTDTRTLAAGEVGDILRGVIATTKGKPVTPIVADPFLAASAEGFAERELAADLDDGTRNYGPPQPAPERTERFADPSPPPMLGGAPPPPPSAPAKSAAAPPPSVRAAAAIARGAPMSQPSSERERRADMPTQRPSSGKPGGGGGVSDRLPLEPLMPAPDTSFLRYGDLAMPRWDDARWAAGKLRPVSWDDRLAELDDEQRRTALSRLRAAQSEAQAVASVALPPLAARVEASAGAFDHRYDAEGLVDVPGDGMLHGVPLLSATAPVRTQLVVVPRESDEAVRMATLTNPLEAPLLAGPAEVYLGDEFLVTTPLRTVPVGGDLTLGLGLEPALKVARNTFFEEEATGLLGGGLALKHRIEIDVASRLSAPAEVEVRELVPLKADDEQAVEVTDVTATPDWEPLKEQEGGLTLASARRWRFTLEPGKEKKLVAGYTLRIDGKNELAGGNRRG